ncbi:uncharacterized protein CC84DRAFT_1260540 [Paraphaeosphaeria sporulosa]|uniref:Uncharacterized protein n=1 Tax=Paraphaeosphaeria sporulosa TaxID=1460663 RepID=A0A177CEX2_9PLEO|nr:uncharacterized protein CC84DRAFT_1260540 [Paraphaeosphaeria sporulosa]OAG05348.1 hypothetical protein CC84DRAFT_1260540 [Paraphaeosphaeria sporulosa]
MPKETRIITRDNIERALKKHDNEITRLFRKLMGTANNPQSQKVKNYKTATDKSRVTMVALQHKFGRNVNDIPSLENKWTKPENKSKTEALQSLVNIVNDNDTLRTLLTNSLKVARNRAVDYYQPVATQRTDTGSTCIKESELEDDSSAENIVEKVMQAKGSLMALPCPDVGGFLEDEIRAKEEKLAQTHIATELPLYSVLPPGYLCGANFTLETHDTYATVLRGEVVWIFWPRTAQNLRVMEQAYQKIIDGTPEEPEALANQLNDGVIFGQPAGRCLRLPPLCIFMCVATEFTVLSRYQLMSASYIVDSLDVPAGFYRSCLGTHGYVRAEQLFRGHSESRREMIERILKCEFETYEPHEWAEHTEIAGPINDLMRKWDEVKGNVAKLLTLKDAAQLRHSWIGLLKVFRSDQCAICGASGKHFSDVGLHFDTAHGFHGDHAALALPDLPAYRVLGDGQSQDPVGDALDDANETPGGDDGGYEYETEDVIHRY